MELRKCKKCKKNFELLVDSFAGGQSQKVRLCLDCRLRNKQKQNTQKRREYNRIYNLKQKELREREKRRKKAKIGDILLLSEFQELKFDALEVMIPIRPSKSIESLNREVNERIKYLLERRENIAKLLRTLKKWNKRLSNYGYKEKKNERK